MDESQDHVIIECLSIVREIIRTFLIFLCQILKGFLLRVASFTFVDLASWEAVFGVCILAALGN